MLENLAIAVLYLMIGFTYGVICHFVAISQRLRASCLGSFIWPLTERIDKVYDNNGFVAKNSSREFITSMTVFGGIKLFINIVVLISVLVFIVFAGIYVSVLIFYDWREKKSKSAKWKKDSVVWV